MSCASSAGCRFVNENGTSFCHGWNATLVRQTQEVCDLKSEFTKEIQSSCRGNNAEKIGEKLLGLFQITFSIQPGLPSVQRDFTVWEADQTCEHEHTHGMLCTHSVATPNAGESHRR